MFNNKKIIAIVVTHNGEFHLPNIIPALRKQTINPDEIVIIDNGSTDNSYQWLNEQEDLTVIKQKNLGRAGGQFTGITYAYKQKADFMWCLDQDIIPAENALEKLVNTEEAFSEDTGFITSLMVDNNNKISNSNIPELESSSIVLNNLHERRLKRVISGSFGSLLITFKAVKDCGLPAKDFFIWGDDDEYTLRMVSKGYKGYLAMKSICIHNQENSSANLYAIQEPSSLKLKYGVRNMVYVIKKRNKIAHNSQLSFSSSFMFVMQILKARKKLNRLNDYKFYFVVIISYIKGLFFNPHLPYIT
ncbi:MAG TPA: glycosyltransferase [Ignavibacteriaceae bacterium]|nr:glycosyltransferase [Ignavibacteriaceae bacterium]